MQGKPRFFGAVALFLLLADQAYGHCTPGAPKECFSDEPIPSCKTCCCKTDRQAIFYDDHLPEPCCRAKSTATYTVRFIATWSAECHPDYYREEAKWSEFSVASHVGNFMPWDSCFEDVFVTPGLQTLAETGKTNVLEKEIADFIDTGKAHDGVIGAPISDGSGKSVKRGLQVHPDFPYVSGAVMQGGTPDFLVGVSNLRLCNGNKWHKRIRVCVELFSTNTTHMILDGQSHSVQGRNCSFGYFEFQLRREQKSYPSPDSCSCQPKKEPFCPRPVQPALVKVCPTCCCQNSKNVVFFNPTKEWSNCTAPRAMYNVTFYATWSRVCHADYYFPESKWSPFSAVSHDGQYQVWNPCMYNRSEGVGVLSNTGATNVIEGEYMAAGRRVLHYVTGDLIGGTGVSSDVLRIDKNHQYISVATMLVPSLDRMMGVAGLDMCDGRRWKKHVRVCGELFSTGYRTNITKRPNTLQDRNCSFGYFDFRLMPPPEPILNRDECPRDRSPSPPPPTRPSPPPPTRPSPPPTHGGGRPSPSPTYGGPTPSPTPGGRPSPPGGRPSPPPPPVGWHSPPADSCLCQPKLPNCRDNPISSCPTCCCNSSGNVEFYDHRRSQKCVANPANYSVTFVGTWTAGCHPDYLVTERHWSPLTGASHDPSYEVWNACMYNVSQGVALVSQRGETATIEGEYKAQGDKVLDTGRGSLIDGDGRSSFQLRVDADHSFVSVLTMLAPSADRMMGVSRLRLCDDTCWRDRVTVCGELFSTATKSERVGTPNTIQSQNCSFGYFLFELVSCEGGQCGPCPAPVPPMTMPTALTGLGSKKFKAMICPLDFVMRATVVHIYHQYMPPVCKMRLMVRVSKKFKGPRTLPGDVRTICMGKSPILIKLGMEYLFAGDYEPTGMGFVIKRNGYIEAWNSGQGNKSITKAKRC